MEECYTALGVAGESTFLKGLVDNPGGAAYIIVNKD